MRWIALAMLIGCGGANAGNCLTGAVSNVTAVRTSIEPGCESQPASIAVTIDPIAWVFTEDGVQHPAVRAGIYNSGCIASATWFVADGSYWHTYELDPHSNRLDVLVRNSCIAHYDLR